MTVDPTDLIQFIVWYANTQDFQLTTIRVVKFVYLADLYYARETGGQTLTGFPWAFVHYGPFCGEVMDCLDTAVRSHKVEAVPFESRYAAGDYYLYRIDLESEPPLVMSLPTSLVGNLKEAIRKWGGDTPALLNHVYFETEPMRGASPGRRLDFSNAVPLEQPRSIQMLGLPKAELLKARHALGRLKDKYLRGLAQSQAVDQKSIIDDAYRQAIRMLEDPPIQGPVTGESKLSIDPEHTE